MEVATTESLSWNMSRIKSLWMFEMHAEAFLDCLSILANLFQTSITGPWVCPLLLCLRRQCVDVRPSWVDHNQGRTRTPILHDTLGWLLGRHLQMLAIGSFFSTERSLPSLFRDRREARRFGVYRKREFGVVTQRHILREPLLTLHGDDIVQQKQKMADMRH